ncbi:MAG TPA: hypothetical protein VEH53_02645, partial [archaeon]|nr:hypothetical protein [archaeon]
VAPWPVGSARIRGLTGHGDDPLQGEAAMGSPPAGGYPSAGWVWCGVSSRPGRLGSRIRHRIYAAEY